MPAIIAAILAALLPVLLEWIRKWIESRLHRAAEGMPELAATATEEEQDAARDALLDKAIKALPKRAVTRRGLLRAVKVMASNAGITASGPRRAIAEADLQAVAECGEKYDGE